MKRAIVIGGAACVWDDLDAARKLFEPDIVVAINVIGIEIEGIDHWVSLHPAKLPRWLAARRQKGYADPVMWSHVEQRKWKDPIERRVLDKMRGTSSLFGVWVAQKEGCDRVVGCGMPMTMEPEFYDGMEGHKWPPGQVEIYRKAWQDEAVELRKFFRSMGGWTAELLGKPDAAWLGV